MSERLFRMAVLVSVTTAVGGLLGCADAPEEPGDGIVVPNPNLSQAPAASLQWDLGPPANSAGGQAEPPPSGVSADGRAPAVMPAGPVVEPVLSEDPYAG